ncbi:MptD family putative ECF transporter S component [Anoxybacterium hadale]|uniref:MptD family putative ECF transporter S component n=1 Tax=Anoxybacterium hadale TaxID=3408580 RepID=A0ACD1AC77_9FIRM|nr:MptD family putative ECF transporter S component [Clostridiales bacterium]
MTNEIYSEIKGLTVKDLVTIGIFTALFFIFTLIGGIPFAPNPVLTFYMPLGSALLCGPIFLLLVAKVPKRWTITILGIIVGLIFFATGMHWAMDLGYMVMGFIADLTAGIKDYKSKKMNILSYVLLCLGATGTYIVFFLDPAGWSSTMLKNGTEQDYLDTMNAAAPPWMLAVILIGTIVAAASGWIGAKLLKKQFEKAGLTA